MMELILEIGEVLGYTQKDVHKGLVWRLGAPDHRGSGPAVRFGVMANGLGSQDGGLLAIDPLSGQTEQIVDFSFSSYGRGALAFDSYRKRVVFSTAIDQGGPKYGLWTADAAGQLELAAAITESTHALAPTGDGRIYVVTPQDPQAPFKYYDAANRLHELLDETGNAPFGPS